MVAPADSQQAREKKAGRARASRSGLDRLIRQAQRRLIMQSFLNWLGWTLIAATGLSILALATARLAGMSFPWAVHLVSLLAAAVTSLLLSWLGRADHYETAVRLDQALGLKDHLATALYVRNRPTEELGGYLLERAENLARQVQVRQAFPWRLGRSWAVVPAMVTVVVVLQFFLPEDLLGLTQRRRQELIRQEAEQQELTETREELAQSAELLRKHQQDQTQPDEETERLLKELVDLSQQDLSNPEGRRQAMEKLSQVQEKLAQRTEQRRRELQSLENALSRLDPGRSGPADRFAEALRRTDFQAATEELKNLAEELNRLSAEERQALRQQLAALAEQLEQIAREALEHQEQARQAIEQELRRAGLSGEQVQKLEQLLDQELSEVELEQQLQQEGLSEQEAQRLAEKLQELRQAQHGEGQCSRSARGLAQALGQARDAVPADAPSGPGMGRSSGGTGWQFSHQQAQRELAQLARMQQELQRLRLARYQARQALARLGASSRASGAQPASPTPSRNPPGRNTVGPGIGREAGGAILGPERRMEQYETEALGNISEGEGRVIASWLSESENVAGPATVDFNTAVRQAQIQAEHALAEDRLPLRYHQAVRTYFQQLPKRSEPAAPSPPSGP